MENRDVFISYKSEDFDTASWVRYMLEINRITCWMAPADIPGGSSYAREIPAAIKGCRVFVVVLSRKAQNSTWVPKELDQAVGKGKIIMPFITENIQLRDDFDFYLSNVQWYTAYVNKAAAIEKMIRDIQALLGKTPLRTAPQPAAFGTEPARQKAYMPKTAQPAAYRPKAARPKTKLSEKKWFKVVKWIAIVYFVAGIIGLIGMAIKNTR